MKSYIVVLKGFSLSFLYFIATTALSTIALNLIRFAVSWLVMQQTASITAFVSIFSISSLIEFYGKPILAPIADYFNRLMIYKICIALSTVCIVSLIIIVWYLKFSIYLLMLPLLLLSAIAALRDPTSAGLVTELVDSEHLIQAQSIRSAVSAIISISAPMFSALIVSTTGSKIALMAAGLASLLALFCTVAIRLVQTQLNSRLSWRAYTKTWHLRSIDGLRAVLLTRAERTTAVVVAISNAGLFPFFMVVLPLWVKHTLSGSALTMAMIEVAFALGILIGSLGISIKFNKIVGRFNALLIANATLGAMLCLASMSSNLVFICLCFTLAGIGFASFNINTSMLRSAATPAAYRARMAAGVAFLSSFLNPFATQAMGLVIEASSADIAVASCGVLIILSTFFMLRNHDAKALFSAPDQELANAYNRLYPAAFIARK